MSFVPKETIEVIAQSIGLSDLSSDVAMALAPDVEYRVREIMQEAIKCMRHSKRTTLTTNDVDNALKLRNMEPLYGFASGDQLRFKRAAGHKDLYYIDDKDVEFKEIIEAPLPKAPLDSSVSFHWLAIEGVQPAVPENAPIEAVSNVKKSEMKEDEFSVDIKLPIRHVVSRELQLYFEKITELVLNKSGSVLFKQALVSLATDSGLHPLLPYFTYFIADEVPRNLSNNCHLLFSLMRVVRSLLQNPRIHIEPYLHQLMPSVITCLVAKRLGNRFSDNHWELRNFTASLLASICKRFGHAYHNLQPRVTKTLLHAFLDPSKALPQHYGAIQGLAALGPGVVRLLILPNLELYLQLLEPEMLLENQKNGMKRCEAWHVYGALLCAAGQCIHDRMKVFRGFLSPPSRNILKSNGKFAIALPNKRKASTDNLTQKPALKKMAVEGMMSSIPMNSMVADMQRAASGFPTTSVGPVANISSSMLRQFPNVSGSHGVKSSSNVLAQAWKEDIDAGKLLSTLFDFFGESILTYAPTPELSLFT